MKYAFDGLISRLDTAEKRISNWRICQQNALKQKSKEKRDKNSRISKNCGVISNSLMCVQLESKNGERLVALEARKPSLH